MGILYYAVNRETREAYELGKGAWFLLCEPNSNIVDCSNPLKILKIISEQIITQPGWAKRVVNDKLYHQEIAKALCKFGRVIEIRDDTKWQDPCENCQIIGSRYKTEMLMDTERL